MRQRLHKVSVVGLTPRWLVFRDGILVQAAGVAQDAVQDAALAGLGEKRLDERGEAARGLHAEPPLLRVVGLVDLVGHLQLGLGEVVEDGGGSRHVLHAVLEGVDDLEHLPGRQALCLPLAQLEERGEEAAQVVDGVLLLGDLGPAVAHEDGQGDGHFFHVEVPRVDEELDADLLAVPADVGPDVELAVAGAAELEHGSSAAWEAREDGSCWLLRLFLQQRGANCTLQCNLARPGL
eukprot:scaffold1149_cov236-Pinguiococcus_pyrenoidosus.AAC.2